MTISKKTIKVGLIKGRHELPVEEFIFEGDLAFPLDYAALAQHAEKVMTGMSKEHDSQDFVVYVTGLTPVTLAVAQVAMVRGYTITFMHFDRDAGGYTPQPFITKDMFMDIVPFEDPMTMIKAIPAK